LRPLGLLIVLLSIGVPLIWYADLFARDPSAVLSQYLASSALIAMGLSQFLATRVRVLETVFGGLDRMYVLHKWIGILSMIALFLHDTIDADIRGLGPETRLSDLAETLGEIGFYGLLILVILTLITFIPYQYWRWSHRLIGAFFALGAIHFAFILKPFENTDLLGVYILSFCVLGLISYLYMLIPGLQKTRRHSYTVTDVEQTGGGLAISLAPNDAGIRHKPGQFAFVGFKKEGLEEVHPFTISKAPTNDRALRFTIKDLGDFTHELQQLRGPDVNAEVEGPYGHFKMPKSSKPQVWIAGGIGVTPFLAWLGSRDPSSPPVTFYYCVRRREDAPHLDEVEDVIQSQSNIRLMLVVSSDGDRLTWDRIHSDCGDAISKARYFYCGPLSLREQLVADMKAAGLPARRLKYEEFQIRSGLNLMGWANSVYEGVTALLARRQQKTGLPTPKD